MSSTRHAKQGTALRQERYSSGFQQGLLANLVAKRCAEIDPPDDRSAIWFLQWRSWQEKIEGIAGAIMNCPALAEYWRVRSATCGYTHERLAALTRAIASLCLDPSSPMAEFHQAVDDYRTKWIKGLPPTVETSIGKQIADALQYTAKAKCLTLIDGRARIGKSFAAQDWCKRSGGLARYVEAPYSNDDISFFRAIAKALGVSSSLQLKAAEIRARVEEVLQGGDLILVIDEAHALWPQSWQRYAMPSRISWVMTALANHAVPVALITTPQFHFNQKQVERLTKWNSDQFIGRIGHLERLPSTMETSDLVAVAKAMFPEGGEPIWKVLAAFARDSKTHLASMDAIVKRARWIAAEAGRTDAGAADIRRVMKERINTFDQPLAARAEGHCDRVAGASRSLSGGEGEHTAKSPAI
jgi:hypothetical protein